MFCYGKDFTESAASGRQQRSIQLAINFSAGIAHGAVAIEARRIEDQNILAFIDNPLQRFQQITGLVLLGSIDVTMGIEYYCSIIE